MTVSGVAYLKYYYFVKDSAGKNNFDIDRAYLNVNGKFAHGITTRITSDLFRPASGTSIDNSLALRIKYAYVGWTPEKSPLTAKIGVTQTPWLDWEEALWDYRQQGTMAMERTGIPFLLRPGPVAGRQLQLRPVQFHDRRLQRRELQRDPR